MAEPDRSSTQSGASASTDQSRAHENPPGEHGNWPSSTQDRPDSDDTSGEAPGFWGEPDEGEEEFSLVKAFGGWGGLLDAGLPSAAFIITFTATGQELGPALVAALVVGAAVTLIRVLRRKPLQNVVGGFVALAIAAYIAYQTGRAEDFYLPGLLINAAYCLGYVVANVARFPIIGVVVGVAAGWGLSWRKDPVLLRAFLRASWLWAAGFGLRLVVQGPLYLAGQVGVLGVARVAMGWPMFVLILWLTYVIIKGSVPSQRWRSLRMSVTHLGQRGSTSGA